MSEDIIRQLVKQIDKLQQQVDGLIKPEVGTLTQPELIITTIESSLYPYSLINGTFLVWQRGTSFAAVANGTYTADRWIYTKSSTVVHTITRDTSVPTVAEAGVKLPYSIKLDVTTADGTIDANHACALQQRIEGYNFLPLAQREFTLSFWVRDTKTGIHCVSFRNTGNDRSYVAEYTISAADTWEYKTITVSASPSAGTWDYTTGIGLRLDFVLAAGTDYHTTANTWQTGTYLGTSNIVNSVDNTANNFQLAGIMLTPGDMAAEIFMPDYNWELDRCQRYYEIQGGAADAIWESENSGGAGAVLRAPYVWQVAKRVAPTITVNGTWATVNVSAGPSGLASGLASYTLQATATAAGTTSYATNSADDTVTGDAEL